MKARTPTGLIAAAIAMSLASMPQAIENNSNVLSLPVYLLPAASEQAKSEKKAPLQDLSKVWHLWVLSKIW